MQGLSHGVVRVDTENSLTSLTLQDCGQVLPGGKYRICVQEVNGLLHQASASTQSQCCNDASNTALIEINRVTTPFWSDYICFHCFQGDQYC